VNVYAPAEEGDGEEPKYLSTMSRGEFFGEEEVLGLETEDSRKLSYVAHSISSVELVRHAPQLPPTPPPARASLLGPAAAPMSWGVDTRHS
jgi:hypothetical protein